MPHDGRGSVVFLFPGQGGDPRAALHNWYHGHNGRSAAAQAVFRDVTDRVLDTIDREAARYGYGPVRPVLLEHSQPDPLPYGAVPLAHFAVSVALTRVLAASEIVPRLIVGHSLGEYAALVCAGAFTLAEGARLVCALNDAYRDVVGRGGLVLVDAGESDTEALLVGAGRTDVAVACVNSPRQAIVSGPTEALDALLALTGPTVPRMWRLPVPYAAHHPALQPVHDHFRRSVADLRPRHLRIPVQSPVQGCAYTDSDDLTTALADCFTKPVRFTDALGRLAPLGERLFVEAGVGDSLSACVRATLPGARTVAPLADGTWLADDTCSPPVSTDAVRDGTDSTA
ncbi:acyltransferase domain-containing protein [Kitasatospora sp. NPDC127116]|uniref:acyltransferase domain-containing protein n=1 Tax=Kitasatospora sp. NPDC127116 TaxID=3345367 RepID=UPI00363AD2E9